MATKLLVGLGNPDAEYENTRHNLGFMFLEYLSKKEGFDFALDKKLCAWVGKTKLELGGKKYSTLVARPESYVNITGPIVLQLRKFAKSSPQDIIIVHDDLDIPLGNVKLSFDKNSGGHRGVESITKALKTKKFFRLRLGIGTPALKKAYQQKRESKDAFVKDFVLTKFSPKEKETLKDMFKDAAELLASPGTQLATQ